MAQLIPGQPTGSSSVGCIRVFQALKRLPDDWTIWLNLTGDPVLVPDFLACHRKTNRCFLLAVIAGTKSKVGSEEIESAIGRLRAFHGIFPFGDDLGLVLCHHELEELPESLERDLFGGTFLGRKGLEATVFEERLLSASAKPMEKVKFQLLRAAFTPESRIGASLAPDDPGVLGASEPSKPLFLDLRQEELAKRDLELSPEASRAIADFSIRLLTGVAGSGKTLVLLSRAVLLAHRFPSAKILVLTFNKPLRQELTHRLERMGAAGRVDCRNFHNWAGSVWKTQGARRMPIGAHDKEKVVQDIGTEVFGKTSPFVGRLSSELDWIQDSGFIEWEDYADAERKGRGFRVTAGQREKFWTANHRWRAFLDQEVLGDYPHFGFRFFQALQDGVPPSVRYDHIFIDEAQFFARTWFDVVRRHLKPQGSLLLCADPSQGFLRSGTSWHGAGFEVRGRTDRLTHSYRMTRETMECAWTFLAGRVLEAGEDAVPPEISRMGEGPKPRIFVTPDIETQIRVAVDEIEREVKLGAATSSFLVLVADPIMIPRVVNLLSSRLGGKVAVAEEATDPTSIRVCSLEKATGLEAAVVYVIGASTMLEAEGHPELTEEELQALREQNGKRLYMAMTRAANVLRMGWIGDVPEELASGCSVVAE